MSAGRGRLGVAERKQAIRDVLGRLAEVADRAGLASTARDIRQTRMPKLDEERFSLVVLGEFNHGKSTFINALLGEAILPVGITPTTAVLAHVRHGEAVKAEAVMEGGARKPIDAARLGDWLTVGGESIRGGADGGGLAYVEIQHPSPFLRDNVTVVDTPGVNDINEQRADITYGYVPRADAVIFLLDAGQILTASERQFLEERILRSSRDRLVFVVTKIDLLDPEDLEEALAFARKHLARLVADPAIFPVSAKRALARAPGDGGRMEALLAHLRLSLGSERRRLLFDHALTDASRLSSFVRQSLGMRRRSLELPMDELAERVASAQERLKEGKRALDAAADIIQAETAALRARVRQDLAAFADRFAEVLPAEIEAVPAPDVQRYLGAFIQDRWKSWLEQEGEMMAGELERLAEKVIEVANERAEGISRGVAEDMAGGAGRLNISVDTFKYDASVFALGALGTTVFLFVNNLAGGLLTLAAPVVAMLLKGRVAQEIKTEARERAPEVVRKVAATVAPKLDEIVDGFAGRLKEFIAEAGAALARGIAEVLDRALAERSQLKDAAADSSEGMAIDRALGELRAIEERIADIRQAVWEDV
jgi:small GTP-binding protein